VRSYCISFYSFQNLLFHTIKPVCSKKESVIAYYQRNLVPKPLTKVCICPNFVKVICKEWVPNSQHIDRVDYIRDIQTGGSTKKNPLLQYKHTQTLTGFEARFANWVWARGRREVGVDPGAWPARREPHMTAPQNDMLASATPG